MSHALSKLCGLRQVTQLFWTSRKLGYYFLRPLPAVDNEVFSVLELESFPVLSTHFFVRKVLMSPQSPDVQFLPYRP